MEMNTVLIRSITDPNGQLSSTLFPEAYPGSDLIRNVADFRIYKVLVSSFTEHVFAGREMNKTVSHTPYP